MDPGDEPFRNFSSADPTFAEKRTVWLEISDMSGETVNLSRLRGTPVALLFGSYT